MTRYSEYPILILCLMILVSGVLLQPGNVWAEAQYEDTTETVSGYGQVTAGLDKEINYAHILEDTDIMSKIIDKTLDKRWPKKYEPSTLFRQSLGCQGVYLKGYGAVFMTNINFPVAKREAPQEEKVDTEDLWQQTRGELRRATGVTTVTYGGGGGGYEDKRVSALKEELLTVIGEYGPNIRQLGPQESVVIVVRGTPGNSSLFTTVGYDQQPAEFQWQRNPVKVESDKLRVEVDKLKRQLDKVNKLETIRIIGDEIKYEVKEPSDVNVKIRNPSGSIVRTLNLGNKSPGKLSLRWDGKNNAGKKVKSGIYSYEAKVGDDSSTGKIIVTENPESASEVAPDVVELGVEGSRITHDENQGIYIVESRTSDEPIRVRRQEAKPVEIWTGATKPEHNKYNAAVQLYEALNLTKTGGSVTGRTTMIIKVSKERIDAYKDGSLDFEDFAAKAEITQY